MVAWVEEAQRQEEQRCRERAARKALIDDEGISVDDDSVSFESSNTDEQSEERLQPKYLHGCKEGCPQYEKARVVRWVIR